MAVLLFAMAASIGVATFIENEYDTITAKELVYNAKWFELILLFLLLNFINNIRIYQLLKWKKWSILLLHFGFIIALIGAFFSRYFGYEGVMLVQEKQTSSEIFSTEPYFQIKVHDDTLQYNESIQHYFSKVFTKLPSTSFQFPGKGDVNVKVVERIENAKKEFLKDVPGGKTHLHLVLPGRENLYLPSGEVVVQQGIPFAFNNNDREDAVRFFYNNDQLEIFAPFEMSKIDMASLSVEDRQSGREIPQDTLAPNILHNVDVRNLISFLGQQIMINSIEQKSKFEYLPSDDEDLPDALKVEISTNGDIQKEIVLGKAGVRPIPTAIKCSDLFFSIAYGSKKIDIPFEVGLADFRLMKYPGSESPSSYESDITILDESNAVNDSFNLFMNHVVDYGGFRFFQSSYDWSEEENKTAGLDPDITILSVNHDILGTIVTYLGYLLLAIGLLGTLFNPTSRFVDIRKKAIKIRNKRKAVFTIFISFLMLSANSQDIGFDSLKEAYKYQPIPNEQADSMGILLVQTYDGRIEPTHTLAYDIFHKISKENDFTTSDNISVNPMQIFIDMILDKPYWLDEKIIYIKKGTGVADSLGIEGKYASVKDFFNPDGTEKLKELVQISFAKKDIEKNVFDKEVIKANERMNIVLQTMNGAFLKIFPISGSLDNKWVDWMDPYAEQPIDTSDQHLANISLSRLFRSYIIDLGEAKKTNNYETAQSLLNFIKAYQIKTAPIELLLNKNQIEREISYNHSNLFVIVKNYYGYLSVLLLIFSFWNALSKKKNLVNKIVKYILWGLIILLIVVFGMHTYALALRWYITDHAPWSNGYEALTFIAWGGVLAGFLFIKSSRITLAGTALLAFCVLMTAGHSSFDPQLTDLQPVLKSYWLVIHVACITISYGFLGLGFILGLINVVNYIFLKPKNKNLKMIISELTYVNEMTLTIGLALATIGTFLGGIWANESWGRYWGWDAKETWALVIVLTYAIILHFRLIPGLKSKFTFNVASVLAFSSVLMTFIGVNYYLSKGLHSYARGETPVFPMWAWITIASIFGLILLGWYNKKKLNKST
jgi:cytochrome c-type biogenesis protein CcsB